MAYLKFRKEKQTKKTKKEENVPNTEVNISKRRRKRKEKENHSVPSTKRQNPIFKKKKEKIIIFLTPERNTQMSLMISNFKLNY